MLIRRIGRARATKSNALASRDAALRLVKGQAARKPLTWHSSAIRTSFCEEWPGKMVGVAGFEPATPASRTQCSTGLSHTPTKNAAYSVAFHAPQEADFGDFEPVTAGLMTEISPAGEADVAQAARALAGGRLVAFPTETVYGLGAD